MELSKYESSMKSLFHQCDTNRDGSLSFDEFKLWLKVCVKANENDDEDSDEEEF